MMSKVLKESIEAEDLMMRHRISHAQAAATQEWVVAKRTREGNSSEAAKERLREAQHRMKTVFPDHDTRMSFIADLERLYLG